MKKIISLVLAGVMALSLAACGTEKPAETNAPETTAAPSTVESALAVLENIWANYGEDEKFAVIGGNMENPVDGAPGNYDMAYAENLTWNLLVPAEQLANVDEAATMIHMMNANTFTSAVLHLNEGEDVAAFAANAKECVMSAQWMCGFPEKLVIADMGGNYLLMAYGLNDAINPFEAKLAEAYPNANVICSQAIAA